MGSYFGADERSIGTGINQGLSWSLAVRVSRVGISSGGGLLGIGVFWRRRGVGIQEVWGKEVEGKGDDVEGTGEGGKVAWVGSLGMGFIGVLTGSEVVARGAGDLVEFSVVGFTGLVSGREGVVTGMGESEKFSGGGRGRSGSGISGGGSGVRDSGFGGGFFVTSVVSWKRTRFRGYGRLGRGGRYYWSPSDLSFPEGDMVVGSNGDRKGGFVGVGFEWVAGNNIGEKGFVVLG
ncbi:uncharacterized protein LOC135163465 [Diachasmimorpha longicaudata]|uniref:uncharacterized protein LOC135163465 n=1 Tax=Diachasmimorpha longicaudata TaxID=58733 RepID=UPI0030B8C004